MPLINGQDRGEVVGRREEEGQFYEGCGRGRSMRLWGLWSCVLLSHGSWVRARLVVRGFPNLDNHKTRVAAGNRNNLKLPLWGIFKPQEVCLVAKKTNLKKVTQKNQNNCYGNNIGTCISILIF